MAVEEAYELAYREAVRALDHQRAALTELQGRAGMLLATASIALSLLGRATSGGLHPLGWLTILCFALLGVVLAVVWPYETGSFDVDPQASHRRVSSRHSDGVDPRCRDGHRLVGGRVMDEQRRRELLWRLYNPQMPDPFISWEKGVLIRDLPSRRTLRERVRGLLWWRRRVR